MTTAEKFSRVDEKRLLRQVRGVQSHITAGDSPNDAIIKVARAQGVHPDSLPLLTQAVNVGRASYQRAKCSSTGDVECLLDEFPLADIDTIKQALYPQTSVETIQKAKQAGVVSREYLHPPTPKTTPRFMEMSPAATPRIKLASADKTAAAPQLEQSDIARRRWAVKATIKQAKDRASNDVLTAHASLLGRINKLANYFKSASAIPLGEVEYNSALLFGEPANRLFDCVAEKMPKSARAKRAAVPGQPDIAGAMASKLQPSIEQAAIGGLAGSALRQGARTPIQKATAIGGALTEGLTEYNDQNSFLRNKLQSSADPVHAAQQAAMPRYTPPAQAPLTPHSYPGDTPQEAMPGMSPMDPTKEFGRPVTPAGPESARLHNMKGGSAKFPARPVQLDQAPYSLVKAALDAAEAYRDEQEHCAWLHGELQQRLDRLEVKTASPQKRAGFFSSFAPGITTGLTNAFATDHINRAKNVTGKLEDPGHMEELRTIHSRAVLSDLMNNDSVISGHSPDAVSSAYNEIVQLSPSVASQPAALRSWLRKRLTAGTLEPFDVQSLAGMESTLQQGRPDLQQPQHAG